MRTYTHLYDWYRHFSEHNTILYISVQYSRRIWYRYWSRFLYESENRKLRWYWLPRNRTFDWLDFSICSQYSIKMGREGMVLYRIVLLQYCALTATVNNWILSLTATVSAVPLSKSPSCVLILLHLIPLILNTVWDKSIQIKNFF